MKFDFFEIDKEKSMKRILTKILSNNLLIAVSINLVFLIFLIILFDIKYQGNDDFGISMFASKSYGEQFYFLGFTNSIYMHIVYILQNSINIINWHVGLEIIFSFISLISITYVVFESSRSKIIRFGVLLVIAAISPQFYIAIQFTKSSALIILSGYLLVLYYLKSDNRKIMLFLGLILIIFGSLIRFENFLMVSVFSILICFFEVFISEKLIFNRNGLMKIARYGTTVMLLFATVAGLKFFGTIIVNKNDEVRYYLDYTKYRAELLDFGVADYNQNQEEYKKLNISKEDLDVLRTWTFADPDKFDLKTFEEMVALKNKDVKVTDFGNVFKTAFRSIIMYKTPLYLLELKIVFVLICLIFLFKSNLKKKIFILFMCFSLVVLYLYLAYIGRILTRAEYGIWLSAIIFSIYYLNESYCKKTAINRGDEIKKNRFCKLHILVELIIVGIVLISSGASSNIIYDMRYKNFIETIDLNQDSLYLIDILTFSDFDKSYNAILPMKNSEYSNVYFLGGCQIKSPPTEKILSNHNVKNPFKDVIDNDKIFIVDNIRIEQKIEYIRRNYDENAYAVHIDKVEGFDVYQIKTKK